MDGFSHFWGNMPPRPVTPVPHAKTAVETSTPVKAPPAVVRKRPAITAPEPHGDVVGLRRFLQEPNS